MVKKVSIWLTLEPLLYSQEFLHLAEISRKRKISHATARKHLSYFEKQGIVIKKKKGVLTLYKINYEHPLIIDYLSIIEKEKIIALCTKDLLMREIISFLHGFDNHIVIFGSSVNGTKNVNDIDALIVGNFKKDKIKEFERKINLKFHIINVKKFKEVGEALKKEIIKNHLIVNGCEDVIKWFLRN